MYYTEKISVCYLLLQFSHSPQSHEIPEKNKKNCFVLSALSDYPEAVMRWLLTYCQQSKRKQKVLLKFSPVLLNITPSKRTHCVVIFICLSLYYIILEMYRADCIIIMQTMNIILKIIRLLVLWGEKNSTECVIWSG